ncbi:hypothetical protein pdam_00012082, partial [Pocillopora damicornis]
GFRSGAGKHLMEQHLSQITDLMKIFLIYHEEVMQTNAVKGTEAIWTQWLESEAGVLQKTLHKQCKEIDCLTLQQKETVDRVDELEVEVKLLRQEQQLCNGRYVWKIENIDRCCEDAISGVSPVMYSPGFYASPHGYKLCLRINLNGVKSGVGTHVALYVHMMRGDYDNHLEWPFSKGFSLSIVDQSDDESLQYHITETVITKPELSAFQRPVPPHNVISSEYSGYEHFAPIDKIHKPQYSNTQKLKIYPDKFAEREMMTLQVFCQANRENECLWKGNLGELEDHRSECPYVMVGCPNDCEKQVKRKDLQQHMATECLLRKISCDYCNEAVLWNELEQHFENCPQYPQQCNMCEKDGIKRGK